MVTVGLVEPRNLRVSDEWYTRFRVAWDPVAAPVLGYKLVYAPAGGTRTHAHAQTETHTHVHAHTHAHTHAHAHAHTFKGFYLDPN